MVVAKLCSKPEMSTIAKTAFPEVSLIMIEQE